MFSWEIDELHDCLLDENYFIRTHFRVNNPFHGLSTISIAGKQEEIRKRIYGEQCVFDRVDERQIGMTTILCAHALWLALFRPSQRIWLMAKTNRQASELRSIIKTGLENLPDFMKPEVLTDHKFSLEFENGSWIHFSNSNADHLKGVAFTCLIADTFEYFTEKDQLKLRQHLEASKIAPVELLQV